jgi:hypothetical protein
MTMQGTRGKEKAKAGGENEGEATGGENEDREN